MHHFLELERPALKARTVVEQRLGRCRYCGQGCPRTRHERALITDDRSHNRAYIESAPNLPRRTMTRSCQVTLPREPLSMNDGGGGQA
jgi:hypothetical protein